MRTVYHVAAVVASLASAVLGWAVGRGPTAAGGTPAVPGDGVAGWGSLLRRPPIRLLLTINVLLTWPATRSTSRAFPRTRSVRGT